MGNCGSYLLCNDESSKNQIEFISHRTMSPQISYAEENSPSKTSDFLKLRSVNVDKKFEIRLHEALDKPMLRRSLSNMNPFDSDQAEEPKCEGTTKFRRSFTKHKTGIKSSFLSRAKERLRRQTIIVTSSYFSGIESVSEESTGTINFDAKFIHQGYVSKHLGDKDPQN